MTRLFFKHLYKTSKGEKIENIEMVMDFLIRLLISGLIIYLATMLVGKKKRMKTAFITAISGAIIFSVAHYVIDPVMVASILGGIGWLLALQHFYNIGWFRSLVVAILIWFIADIVSSIIPTLTSIF